MAKVAAYVLGGNGLAQRVVPYMIKGAQACGDAVWQLSDQQYMVSHPDTYDVAVFWGYVTSCQTIMKGYLEAGKKVVYLDLAYWRRDDHYKVCVDARHPTAYFQSNPKDGSRRKRFVNHIRPYRVRDCILVAGLSPKAAWAENLEPAGSFEIKVVEELRKYTQRPIIYRPKPTWGSAPVIPNTIFSPGTEHVDIALSKSWSVVTHHSNVAVDGLIDGAAAFCKVGAASVMGTFDLSKIEDPVYPDNREQWLNDLAYCQWSVDEMRNGTCWRHLKDEGLIP